MDMGFNTKRMLIALVMASVFGFFCAWGTTTVEIPGFVVSLPYLATVFYARVLIGFAVGLNSNMKIAENENVNSLTRGALMGAIVSPVISFFGGFEILMCAGIIYGALTDLVATKLS